MNDIEILEEFLEDYIHDGLAIQYRVMEAIENLIQKNKELEQILELTSKSLDNISYNQIPIAIEELKFKLQNLEEIEREHKEENGRLREENEVLRYGLRENKILRHGLEENTEEIDKLYKIINLMAIDLEYINKEILDEYDKLPYAESKQKVIDYFTNKVEESEK